MTTQTYIPPTRMEKIRNAFIIEAVWQEKFEEIIKHPDFLKLSNPKAHAHYSHRHTIRNDKGVHEKRK